MGKQACKYILGLSLFDKYGSSKADAIINAQYKGFEMRSHSNIL